MTTKRELCLVALFPLLAAGDDQFLDAIRKGNVKKIHALVNSGTDVNKPVVESVDIENLVEISAGEFRYRFKKVVGGSLPMLRAIESARPESVEALIAHGANVKAEFFEDARSNVGISADTIASNISLGLPLTITGGRGAVLRAGPDKTVISSVRPTPAKKVTYVDFAVELLGVPDILVSKRGGAPAISFTDKRLRGISRIIDILLSQSVQPILVAHAISAQSCTGQPVPIDGLYRINTPNGKAWSYLRFYRDGTVFTVSIIGLNPELPPDKHASELLEARRSDTPHGCYAIGAPGSDSGVNLNFSIAQTDNSVTREFDGRLVGDVLSLTEYRHGPGLDYHAQAEYHLLSGK